MGRAAEFLRAHRPTTRRLAQLYCALLYNAHLKGFPEGSIYTGAAKAVCVPGLNCYSCPGAVGACPLGAMQNALASAGTRSGAYVFGILMLFGVMLGRTVCGWLCPVGLFQELLHRIPTPKLQKSRITRGLSLVKYLILALFAVALPLWYALKEGVPVPAFCKYICPAGTFEGAAALLSSPRNDGLFAMLGTLFTRKWVILSVIVLSCVFCWRAFCRFVCPLGAIYSLFSSLAVIGVRVDESKCTRCGACVRACGMDVKRVGDRECIHCGECMSHCAEGAISIKCGRITLRGAEGARGADRAPEKGKGKRAGRIVRGILTAFLLFAVLWFNVLSPGGVEEASAPARSWESSAPVGSDEGMQPADFTVSLVGGGAFHLADARGRVTVINLWATWCGPCVEELPVFSDFQTAHPDACVLAIHSPDIIVEEDVVAFTEKNSALNVLFAMGEGAKEAYAAVGGGLILPQTAVLNARGEVVYNQPGRMTAKQLEELYERAKTETGP